MSILKPKLLTTQPVFLKMKSVVYLDQNLGKCKKCRLLDPIPDQFDQNLLEGSLSSCIFIKLSHPSKFDAAGLSYVLF